MPQQCLTSAQVELDNALSKSYTKVELVCLVRMGLLFDIMRTLKDISIRVAYGAQLGDKHVTGCRAPDTQQRQADTEHAAAIHDMIVSQAQDSCCKGHTDTSCAGRILIVWL